VRFFKGGWRVSLLLMINGAGCRGLARNGWDDVPIVACETRGAESFARMLEERELVALPQITSIAKSLGALKVAEVCPQQKDAFHLVAELYICCHTWSNGCN
jgi:hypothetical protein